MSTIANDRFDFMQEFDKQKQKVFFGIMYSQPLNSTFFIIQMYSECSAIAMFIQRFSKQVVLSEFYFSQVRKTQIN